MKKEPERTRKRGDSDADGARNQEEKTKTQTFPGEETTAATAWSMPTRLAVTKEIIRDNSAQREDPVAKEPRFDRVTKKMNKNHRRPIDGGEHEVTKEEELQKTTRQEKARSTRGDEPVKGNRRKRDRGRRSREPKDRKAGRQESQREEH